MDPHSAFVWKRGQDAIDNGTNQIYFGNSRIAANRAVRANRQAFAGQQAQRAQDAGTAEKQTID